MGQFTFKLVFLESAFLLYGLFITRPLKSNKILSENFHLFSHVPGSERFETVTSAPSNNTTRVVEEMALKRPSSLIHFVDRVSTI
jgi:hypothetical protein